MTTYATLARHVESGLRWLFCLEYKKPVDPSRPPLRHAYDEGYLSVETQSSNPYLEGTKLYGAWEYGAKVRNRHEMIVIEKAARRRLMRD